MKIIAKLVINFGLYINYELCHSFQSNFSDRTINISEKKTQAGWKWMRIEVKIKEFLSSFGQKNSLPDA